MAEVAALLATVLAVVGAYPQVHRVVRVGDGRGVSVCSAALGIGSEAAWLAYAVDGGLWSVLPEALLMAATNTLLALTLVRRGASARQAVPVGLAWVAVLGIVTAVGGPGALGIVLGLTYGVQVAPAVWTVWRTPTPSGVAAATWALIGAEGLLWGAYGIHHGDPAVTTFAATATVAAAATLTRKALTAPGVHRRVTAGSTL